MSSPIKPGELLEESVEVLNDKRSASKQMNMIAGDTAKMQGIEKPIIVRCKDYKYYKGRGWTANNPLELDSEERFKDRVSPTFIKLAQIIDDLDNIDRLQWLDEYIAALKTKGIELKISAKGARANDCDEVEAAINNMMGFQQVICEKADILRDEKAEESEEISFTPKNQFNGVLNMFDKKQRNKDVDDAYQKVVTELEMTEAAYNAVYDENL